MLVLFTEITHKPLAQLTLADIGELIGGVWLTVVICYVGWVFLGVLLKRFTERDRRTPEQRLIDDRKAMGYDD